LTALSQTVIDEIPTTDKIAVVSVSHQVKKQCKKKKEDISKRMSTDCPQKPLPQTVNSKNHSYFKEASSDPFASISNRYDRVTPGEMSKVTIVGDDENY